MCLAGAGWRGRDRDTERRGDETEAEMWPELDADVLARH